jgi:glycosyltransferase involved in cell wall biosynthesis
MGPLAEPADPRAVGTEVLAAGALKTVVCLPTRNEAKSIAPMIEAIRAVGLDVFVCDQQSTDGTIEIAASLGVAVHQRDGNGKGWGVRKALEAASAGGYDVLVLIDCDCTYRPEDIPCVVAALGACASAIGARPMREIAWPNRLVNYLHTGAVNLLFGARLRDINSGLRALRVATYRGAVTAEGFDIEAQMTLIGLRSELGVAEVPVGYRKRVGESKVRAWDAARILWRIVRERFR